jgi:hypothetical protein
MCNSDRMLRQLPASVAWLNEGSKNVPRCHQHATKDGATDRLLKIIYSERGGHSYGQTIAYHELLKNQSKGGKLLLTKRRIM